MRAMCIAAALAALLPVPAAGQDMTREKIEQAVAKDIAPLLRKHGRTEVRLAAVTWAATGKVVDAGSGLLLSLEKSLAAHGIGVTPSATAVLRGTQARVTDPQSKSPALKLVLRVEIGGKPEAEVPILILLEDTFRSDPINVVLPPTATPAQRSQLIADARREPPPLPKGGSVLWSGDGTVGLEMLLAKADAVRQGLHDKLEEGKLAGLFAVRQFNAGGRIETAAGEYARFRIVNKNPFELAGAFRVAGLDWCAFADLTDGSDRPGEAKAAAKERPQYLVVVPANSSVVVRGWLRTKDATTAFEVKELPANAPCPHPDTGVVSFEYKACWPHGAKPAPGEEAMDAQMAQQHIGEGCPQGDKFEVVKRVISPKTRGVVKLEYGAAAK